MSVGLLSDAYQRARTLLDDDEASNWPDHKLFSKAQIAFEELEAELIVADIPIINSVTAVITVPAMTTDDSFIDMSTVSGYPTDMILPIWLKERQLGQMNQDFVDMLEVDFIPNINIDIYLHYWCWQRNVILLRGCLNPVQVQIRYQRYLPLPGVNTDSLIVPLAQLYLAPRIAAQAAYAIGDRQRWIDFTDQANQNLLRILDMSIKELQDLPAKRRPYHRGYGRNRVLRDF